MNANIYLFIPAFFLLPFSMSAQDPPRVSPLNENRVGLYVVAQPVIPGLISQLRPELESKTYQEAAPSVSDAAALLAIVLSGNDVYRDIVIPYTDEAYLTRFLEENTWLQEELQRAWTNKDYAKLLQYSELTNGRGSGRLTNEIYTSLLV